MTHTPYGGATQTVPAPVLAADWHEFTRTLTHNAVVRISTPVTYDYEAGAASFRIGVAPRLHPTVAGWWDRQGSAYLVRSSVDPTFRVTVRPDRDGTCAHTRVQRYSAGAWRHVLRSGCLVLSSSSTASWRMTGDFAAGARYRVRWETPGDAANIAGTGAWQEVRFTR